MAGGRTEAPGLPLGGIGDQACVDFLGGSGGGFTDLALVGSENFLAGSRGGFTDLALVGSENFLAGSGGGFTKLGFVGCDSTGDGKGFAYAAWLGWAQLLTERETVKTASAMIAHIFNHDALCRGGYASSLMIIAKGLVDSFSLKLG